MSRPDAYIWTARTKGYFLMADLRRAPSYQKSFVSLMLDLFDEASIVPRKHVTVYLSAPSQILVPASISDSHPSL